MVKKADKSSVDSKLVVQEKEITQLKKMVNLFQRQITQLIKQSKRSEDKERQLRTEIEQIKAAMRRG